MTITGVVKTILPVEISNQARKYTLLFQGVSGSVQLTRAYLACLQPHDPSGKREADVISSCTNHEALDNMFIPRSKIARVYNFGEIVSQLAVRPLTEPLTLSNIPKGFLRNSVLLVDRLLHCTDDSYAINDPVPFWWLYQVYVPLAIIMGIIRR